MKKGELKVELFHLLDQDIEDMTFNDKIILIEKYLIEYQRKNEDKRDCPNSGKPWSDEELQIILESAPTTENCLKYAKLFGRGYGSIEQIYRWAATTDKEVERKRPNDAFIAQIKRVAKKIGWRA